jgi:hypothetical protein
MLSQPSLTTFIPFLQSNPQELISFFTSKANFSDPIYQTSTGIVKLYPHITNLGKFFKRRVISSQRIIRTSSDEKRHVLEIVVTMNDGMIWDSKTHSATKSDSITVPIAIVGDYDLKSEKYDSIRMYFGTWAVLNACPVVRKADVTERDEESVEKAFGIVPVVKKYFDYLIKGSLHIVSCFEEDGYIGDLTKVFQRTI